MNGLKEMWHRPEYRERQLKMRNSPEFKERWIKAMQPVRKLTDDEVREIRESDATQSELAKAFGVSQTAIFFVKHRRTYRHVE